MPTLYITEFAGINTQFGSTMNCAVTPSLVDQAIAFTATSTQSATLNPSTCLIRVVSDTNCFKKIGTNPTATQTTVRVVADSVEYFAVPPNSGYKIAVVTAA